MRIHIRIYFISFFLLLSVNVAFAKSTLVLKKGMTLSRQITVANTRYEITDDFDLMGKTLTVPKNCELDFKGGSISNGTIVFSQTVITNPMFSKMHFRGSTPREFFDIMDFGAKPGLKTEDCAVLINELITLKRPNVSDRNAKTIHIPNGTFYIKSPINLWAGWEAPITLEGNGNTSTICQLSNNETILNVFECHYVKNLRLTYNSRQDSGNAESVAIACQRAIFCLFENLTICKANTAFGYISLERQKKGFNPTGIRDQCYVSCNFRNIRIYETSGYAMDFKKDFPQGDSGSAFDNIYINSNDWLGNTKDNVSKGALRGDNSVACFSQLNIEGKNYSNALIELGGMSRVAIESLHLEGLKKIPSIAQVRVQSVAFFNIVDVQNCEFANSNYYAFSINNSGWISVNILTVRQDCNRKEGQALMSNSYDGFEIGQKLDAAKVFK